MHKFHDLWYFTIFSFGSYWSVAGTLMYHDTMMISLNAHEHTCSSTNFCMYFILSNFASRHEVTKIINVVALHLRANQMRAPSCGKTPLIVEVNHVYMFYAAHVGIHC